jgi:Nif-specific regulatory protein
MKMNEHYGCKSPKCDFSRHGPSLDALTRVGDINCRSVQELSVLFSISQTLEKSFELGEIMRPVLRDLSELLGLERGTITILNRDTNKLQISEAVGIPNGVPAQEYIDIILPHIEQVVEKQDAIVITRFSDWVREMASASKFYKEAHLSTDSDLLCVPMKHEDRVIGTLSIERSNVGTHGREADLRLLTMIASIIGQAASVRQNANEQIESLKEENHRLHISMGEQLRPEHMIGNSSSMREVYAHICQVAESAKTTVLIRGESGTGKELVAKAIHEGSARADQAFVKFNCAALPDSIIESELFGHEKGAFTGAVATRKGRFEAANRGTIFLDEIGDISPATQVKLLRVLQEKELERVGSQDTISVNVRIIAATSRNIEQMMYDGSFREDLYYRLNVFPIYMPPLRERKSDILLLADHFIEKFHGKKSNLPRISSAAIDMLMSYHWPGNVRELENCMERAVLLSKGQSIKAHHLPPTLMTKSEDERKSTATLDDAMEALEREMIVDTLKDTAGNMTEAARRLGITERKMGIRVKKYEIEPTTFKG